MKKLMTFGLIGACVMTQIACSKSDNNDGGGPVTPTTTVDVRGTITADTKWTKDKIYRIRGWVYVTNNSKLTIEEGTKIVSNKDSAGILLIYKGAQLIADGKSANTPIVFTSAEASPAPGDFGGIILVGNATGNGNHATLEGNPDAAYKAFGGTNDADNSGILRYVRIEYPGKAVNPNDEINGLSLYAVGSGTTIDYVQVTRSQDDAFEFFGGAVNCKHLIAYNCADDDYDMDDAYHGKIQYAISIKDPKFTDVKSGGDLSNNFEIDNTNGKIPFNTKPTTNPIMSNFTAVGPNIDSTNRTGTKYDDYGFGMRVRRGSRFILANSIIIGAQKAGLSIEDDQTAEFYANKDSSKFYNNFLNARQNPFRVALLTAATPALDSAKLASITKDDNLSLVKTVDEIGLTAPFTNTTPNVAPKTGSAALTTAGKFDKGTLTDAFFDKTSFIGAIGTTDWTATWTAWNK